MKNLKDLSLRNKLILLVVLPLSVLLYFLQKTIASEFDRKDEIIRITQNVAVIERISALIHQLQKEGNATQIVALNQKRDGIDIIAQQERTDMAIADLKKISTKYKIQVPGIDTLSTLSIYRKPLSSFPHIAHQVNQNLLDQINIIGKAEKNREVKSQTESILLLLYLKEFLAQLHMASLSVLTKDSNQRESGNFHTLKGKYEMTLYAFKKNSPAQLLDYFNTNFEKAAAVVRMNSAIENFSAWEKDASLPIDRETWSTDISNALNILTSTEDFAFESIKGRIATESESIQWQLTKKIALASLIVIVLISFAVILINTIVSSVTAMRGATERIMKGDIDFELNVTSKDEIGQLAGSFNKIISVFKDYIEIADSIGQGNYDFNIRLRSDKDFLGKALGNMRDNLNNLYKEKETTTWLLTGNNSLNDKFREEKELRNLARDIITQIASYLKVQVGAIYLVEHGRINRVASYAYDSSTAPESFEIGQSLVGQAVQDRKPIVFEKVPPDYIKIISGLGSALPTNIIVFPFFYIGKVKGVIELGASKEFTALDQEYLRLVGDNIASAFNSSQSRSKLKELLEETQRQAEELESQQEELKQFNDELLDKIKSIEISEAALKVQQEELQQSNAELEETARMLESDKQVLEKAKITVEEKARSLESLSKYKSQFLANMSHELRTPLNSILILTQLLIENKNGSLNEKEIKYTNVIYNAGNELLTLINDILDLSKVESGNMELVEEEVPLQEIVNDMTMMFSEVAKNKSIAFQTDVSNIKERLVYTDKQRLEQILRNFLSNAFKFTPANGVVILSVYKPSGPKVELKKLNVSQNIVAFSVSDTGIGIQKDKQELIFEAFRQVDSTDKRKYGGTGLGLSISRELADLLGGEIDLTSEEGKGSTFTFYLPLRSSTRHDSTFKTRPTNGSELKKTEHLKREEESEEVFYDDRDTLEKNSRTILIMEDDQDFAQVILAFVRERNYKGIIAHQGNTGLNYARHYKPDAILLDMKLPVIDGEEVIRQLKNDPGLRHIPIQIISGYSLRKEAMKLGAFDFIKKPVKKENLEKVFEKLEDFASRKYKRLLIIENNPDENKAMCDLIGNGDVECVPAFSINEAYKKLNEISFDCIVVDIGVSDPSGFEFLEKIKANSLLNQIPIIVYSVQDLTKEQNQKLAVLANTVVLKTALSHERLLDETTLFLHRVEANMPKEKQRIIRKLHQADTVLKDKTILIVDDDMRNIYSLTSALEEEGMHCLTAENGREAVKLLDKNPAVNIILMDVMMPEMDGYEATIEIRKSKNFAKIPIIAITAKAMKGDREKCLAVGMSDYISKPVDINQLLSLMRVWLYN